MKFWMIYNYIFSILNILIYCFAKTTIKWFPIKIHLILGIANLITAIILSIILNTKG